MARIDETLVLGVDDERLALARGRLVPFAVRWSHHLPDLEAERLGEVVVALVVRRDRHDRARPVLHQDVVGNEHRNLLPVDGVGNGSSQRHPRLRLLGRSANLR